ncbi:hypothetical protein DQG23_39990 [Paenibacillus contaminans]|uniref:Acetylxylan esterase n=2 Tax=Paenibacillus contaminans TaxID=450362 RepID=A0A329LRH0_9BACL|nr:hypothetical protein DQG23_39990 [Paenibacillus contaminans]
MRISMQYLNTAAYVNRLDERYKPQYEITKLDLNHTDWHSWRTDFRSKLAKLTGLSDMQSQFSAVPLQVRAVSREERSDYTIEKLFVTAEPGVEIPFYLLLPLGKGEGCYPLVLTPHGHGPRGKETYVGHYADEADRAENEAGERDIALQAVKAGYAAIAMDVRGFAEMGRRQEWEQNKGSSCLELQRISLLYGRTLIGERVFDIGRLIDYAATRPEIDTSRIAITGNSGGGTVSLFAAALDERITVCAPSSYFCTFRDSIMAMHHCSCNYIPGILQLGEMYDVAALVAPRPLLLINGKDDMIFPIEAAKEAFSYVHAVYAAQGAADRCRQFVGHEGHRYYKEPVWPFMKQYLSR